MRENVIKLLLIEAHLSRIVLARFWPHQTDYICCVESTTVLVNQLCDGQRHCNPVDCICVGFLFKGNPAVSSQRMTLFQHLCFVSRGRQPEGGIKVVIAQSPIAYLPVPKKHAHNLEPTCLSKLNDI